MGRNQFRILGIILTFGSIALYFGCQPSSKADKSKSSSSQSTDKQVSQPGGANSDRSLVKSGEKESRGISGTGEKTVSKRIFLQTPSPVLTIPKVGFTDALLSTCLVNVGDIMPEGELFAADGGKISTQSQYGEKLTVVFFWEEGRSNYAKLAAASTLKDLQMDVAEPYAEKGVKVIGINSGDKSQAVQQELEKIGVKLPYFFDPDKVFFGKVAKSMLPRVYLLDASGKIIWFDTDYSQSTRRNMMQAIQVVLGEK